MLIHMDNLVVVNFTRYGFGLMISRAIRICVGNNKLSIFDQPSALKCNQSTSVTQNT